MTVIYVDPSAVTNGAGTLGSPRNVPPTSIAYGDYVLFKEGTRLSGGWIVPVPTGTPFEANRVVIGTYDAESGARIVRAAGNRRARIDGTGSLDALLIQRDYVTAGYLELREARNFPNAGVRVLNASNVTVEDCFIDSGDYPVGGAYGIRFDNATGSGAARSGWIIRNNTIDRTTGNAGIICVWSSTAGESVSDITVEGNTVTGNLLRVAGATNDGITIIGRATTYYTNPTGLKSKGVRVRGNVVRRTHSYAFKIQGAMAGGTQTNEFTRNEAYEIGDGATDMHCIWLAACEDFLVEGNVVNGSNAWMGQDTGTGVGIFIDKPFSDLDGCLRVRVRGNDVRNTGRGGTLNSEVGGAGILCLLSSDVRIESNVVVGCKNGVVVIGRYGTGTTNNVRVANNLVDRCDEVGIYTVKDAQNVSVVNNVVTRCKYGIGVQLTGLLPVSVGYSEQTNVTYGHTQHAYMSSNEPEAAVPAYTSRTAPGGALQIDPMLRDSSDAGAGFRDESPCWRAGTFIGAEVTDFTGVPFSRPVDIGPWARPQYARAA
ncbi:hypothetical protein [Microcystis phage Mae-JY22]